ncbi:MAG: AsmA family protein [Bacteroidetes bacterium]|nr:AsmA family protein [Bacteroidota bacterium]
MKRLSRILKITGITLLAFLLLLVLAPFLFKSKIVKAIKNTANSELNATLNFDDDISISFLRSFPNVSLKLEKLSIVGKDSFAGDTLLYFPSTRLTLDVMSVFKGEEIQVKKVFLQNPDIRIETLPSGRANWDIVKTDTTQKPDTAPSTFKLALKEFNIEKGNLIYNDRSLDFYTELRNFDHSSTGDFTADNFTMETETHTPSLILGYGGINWLYKIKTDVIAKIQMDMKSYKFSYEKASAKLNNLEIESNGFVDLNDNDIDMDIAFKALQNDFKSFLSLVPGVYSESFKDVKASGSMGLMGSLKGKMTDDKMPATYLALNIQNGSFQYPSLPYAADQIFLDAKYTNPDGMPDNSVIDIKRFLMRIAGESFTMNALLKTPVSDPYVDGGMKGRLDLSKILGLIPMEKGTKLAGIIDADLKVAGNYSSVQKSKYQNFKADGRFKMQNLLYQSVTDKSPYTVDALALNFTPQKVDLTECKGVLGKSDFDVKGTVDNIFGYLFSNEVLKGKVAFKSKYFNLNQFMSDEESPDEPKATDTGNVAIVELPANLDFILNAEVGKIIYDNYTLSNVSGTAHLHDAVLDMEGLRANLLGGTIALDGTYDSKNVKNPFTKLDTKLEQLNFAQSFEYFPILSKYAPIAKYVDGLFNASIDMNSILNEKMQPNYESMNVNGMVSFNDAAIKNSEILQQIAKQLNVNWLENLTLKNQKIKFSIKEGVFQLLDSLVVPLPKGATMKLSGATKLDKTIKYGGWIKVPREAMGAGNQVLNGWVKQAAGKGWNLNVDPMIPVDLSIAGTFLKPVVNVSLKGFAKSTAAGIKDQATGIAKDEANKKLDEALKKAKAESEKIIAEAQRRSDQLREEGHNAAEKIRRESKTAGDAIRKQGDDAYAKVMNETEVAAKKAEDQVTIPALKKAAGDKVRREGQKKAQQSKDQLYLKAQQTEEAGMKRADAVESEANNKADLIMKEAKERADKIMKEAEDKGKVK